MDLLLNTRRAAALALMLATAGCAATLPVWNANDISLGATASGILTRQGDCVTLQADRNVMPIWPAPSSVTERGIATPGGSTIPFGTDITLEGAYAQEGTPFWDRAEACGAIPFSVNRDGIRWTED